MKTPIKITLIVLGCLAGGMLAFAGYVAMRGIPHYPAPEKLTIQVEVTPERVARGLKIAQAQCIVCHSNTEGTSLSGKMLPDLPKEFGLAYSANITQHPVHGIGKYSDGELIRIMRTGVRPDGSYLPIYMPKFLHMSDEDVKSVVAFLRSDNALTKPADVAQKQSEPSFLLKFLTFAVPAFQAPAYPAAPIPEPDTTNMVAYGKYLALGRYECYQCHSADFKTNNGMMPEKSEGFFGGGNPMPNEEGKIVRTANITPDNETGIGSWSEAEFTEVLKTGIIKRRNTTLRYPMFPYTMLEDKEVKAIYAYLRTVPAVKNAVNREATNPE